jgi:hypothetical protein
MTPLNHTTLTLGELLSSTNNIIKRNALSILKTLQRLESDCEHLDYRDTLDGAVCNGCGIENLTDSD